MYWNIDSICRGLKLNKPNEEIEALTDFGLTRYEALIYLSALKLGLSTASKIGKAAGIRREEVYRTIPKLEKAGLLERVLGRPIKVRALPIEDALEILVERQETEASKKLRNLIVAKEELIDRLGQETQKYQEKEDHANFVLITEKDTLSKRVSSLIQLANSTIDFIDSFENAFRFVLMYAEALKDARKKDVRIRILTNYPNNVELIPKALKKHVPENSFVVKYSDRLPSRYAIFDSNNAMITTSTGDTFSGSKCLWTNDSNLVGIIQRDFEDQFRDSIDWKDIDDIHIQKLARIMDRLKPRDHLVLFYDSTEAKHNTLFSYISKGLELNEAVAYVCAEETPEQIMEAMQRFGIDVERGLRTEALTVLDYTDMYIRDGEFDMDIVMASWAKFYDDAIAKGFKGLRVTGEMSCFVQHDLVEELVEYEHALHTILDIPMIAICAYNSNLLSKIENPINVYSELVRAHGKVLFAGRDNRIGKIEVRAG
ncbi:hypothetical protein EU527_18280 [Candidatus Thorarchaeota archaeon]|nr:MAG: hypothetical protein EU527_18280 [Candidatus Thorarchaeota archaeon]